MKLKVYIVKKQQLIWAAIILAIIIIAAILIISLRTKNTVNMIGTTQTTKADINKDGKFDIIVVKADEKTRKLSVDISLSDGNGYSLEADPSIKSLGYYTNNWPTNISIHDINGDGRGEIVLQSSDNKGPILHIFSYRNNQMERITSGRYSTFGFTKNPLDSSNTLILGTKNKNEIQFSYFNVNSNKLTPKVASTSLTLGRNALNSLIEYIEKEDIETFSTSSESKLVSKISKGTYLDSKIYETKYTNYNIPSECTYIVRTIASENKGNEYIAYKVKLSLSKYDTKNPEYKITNIEKTKN